MAFNKKTWATGNIITAMELNRLETALDDAFTNKAEKTDLTSKADQAALTALSNEIGGARGSFGSLTEKLNNMVISGGGSAGALVFNTLAELQAAYPSGTTQPVWIVADNAWYYWNGTVTPPADTTAPTLTITAGGTFTGTKSVTMSANETATIYYTLDGSAPTTASAVYSSALSITATTTLKAFAKDTAGNSSAVQTVTYTLDTGAGDTTAPVVTASPAAGTYTSAQSVTLSANETATIYYTTNGTTPTTASTVYSGPISISATTTLQFIGKDSAGNTSTPVAATYTINLPADTTAPVLTITPAATFTDTQTVTMSINETGTIWYTLDGTDPTTSGTKLQYSSPLTLSATTTVKAYAVDSANNASAVQTVTYTKQSVGLPITDSFNRADNATTLGNADTGQAWQIVAGTGSTTTWGIISNQAYNIAGQDSFAIQDAAVSDCTIQVKVSDTSTKQYSRLIFRFVDKDNHFMLQNNTTNYQLYKKAAGTFTALKTIAVTPAIGDIMKVVLSGSTITPYINGVAQAAATETFNQTATKHGIGVTNSTTNAKFDDFSITA